MSLRELFVENFAGDLEYHPRRGGIYIVLAAFAFLGFFSSPVKTTVIPLVAFLGSLSLVVKAIFLFRKSSEGLGLSPTEIGLSEPLPQRPLDQKGLPPLGGQAAQMLQDFGTGPFLLWPLLEVSKNLDDPWSEPVGWWVFAIGAALFFTGWLIRRTMSAREGLTNNH